jgi:hypothetical protein
MLPVGVDLGDMGRHRLKDLFRPEHVFQVRAPGLLAGVADEAQPVSRSAT